MNEGENIGNQRRTILRNWWVTRGKHTSRNNLRWNGTDEKFTGNLSGANISEYRNLIGQENETKRIREVNTKGRNSIGTSEEQNI